MEQTTRQLLKAENVPMRGGPLAKPMIGGIPGGMRKDTEDLVQRGKELFAQSQDYQVRFDTYLRMDRKQVRKKTRSREVADAREGFTAEAPLRSLFCTFLPDRSWG